jgi:hypothetical protein
VKFLDLSRVREARAAALRFEDALTSLEHELLIQARFGLPSRRLDYLASFAKRAASTLVDACSPIFETIIAERGGRDE